MEGAHTVEDHVHSSWCLLISSVLLAITAITCSTLRSIIRAKLSPSLPVLAVLDFLCGIELCVCGQELGVILDLYGIPIFSGFLWLIIFWQANGWGDATANPAAQFEKWWRGGQPSSHAFIRAIAGALGGFCSLLVLAPLWALELSHFHQGRAERSISGVCGEDLKVDVYTGMAVELIGTMVCCLSAVSLSSMATLKPRPILATALDSVVAVLLVLAAFDLTGGYYNPALATGIKLGCGTNDTTQYLTHLAVYWVGPCLGTVLAAPIFTMARNITTPTIKKEEKKDQ